MLAERRSKYLLWFAVFMVVFYISVGLLLCFTGYYQFENKILVGISLIVYGVFRAARIWNASRENSLED